MRFGARLRAKQERMRTFVRAPRRMWRKRGRDAEIAAVYAADMYPRGFVGFRNAYSRAIRKFACGEPDTSQRFWWAR